MARLPKDPLRPLTPDEHVWLERLSRSHAEPAAQVARAKALLAVAAGQRYTEAARAAGRRSGDAVAQSVACFNRHGLAALKPGHGGGQPKRYTRAEQERILRGPAAPRIARPIGPAPGRSRRSNVRSAGRPTACRP